MDEESERKLAVIRKTVDELRKIYDEAKKSFDDTKFPDKTSKAIAELHVDDMWYALSSSENDFTLVGSVLQLFYLHKKLVSTVNTITKKLPESTDLTQIKKDLEELQKHSTSLEWLDNFFKHETTSKR